MKHGLLVVAALAGLLLFAAPAGAAGARAAVTQLAPAVGSGPDAEVDSDWVGTLVLHVTQDNDDGCDVTRGSGGFRVPIAGWVTGSPDSRTGNEIFTSGERGLAPPTGSFSSTTTSCDAPPRVTHLQTTAFDGCPSPPDCGGTPVIIANNGLDQVDAGGTVRYHLEVSWGLGFDGVSTDSDGNRSDTFVFFADENPRPTMNGTVGPDATTITNHATWNSPTNGYHYRLDLSLTKVDDCSDASADGASASAALRPAAATGGVCTPLKAKIAGGRSRSAERAGQLTFASASTGPVKSYQWSFTYGADCPSELKGRTWSPPRQAKSIGPYTILCGLTVALVVKDKNGRPNSGGPAKQTITVTPRQWHVGPNTHTDTVPTSTDRRVSGDVLGLNVGNCAGPDGGAGEAYPFCPIDNSAGYTAATVSADQPFAGLAYVSKASFSIDRKALYNARFQKGGDVYEHNVAIKKYRSAMLALAASIFAHEKSHTQAMQTAAHTEKGDVNAALEKLIGDPNKVIDRADQTIDNGRIEVWNYALDGSGHLAGAWEGALQFPDGPNGEWVPEDCTTTDADALDCQGAIVVPVHQTGKRKTVDPGQQVPVIGPGFEPGEGVIGKLKSAPIDLGTVSADSDGVATFTVEIPIDFSGDHEIALTGQETGSTYTLPLTVRAGATTSGPVLASTGMDAGTALFAASLSLLVGGAALRAGRRRRLS